jgi:signal transduction histidine kinase
MRMTLRPRLTVRLRLTLLYATLFLLSSGALLAITYLLVRQAIYGSHIFQGLRLPPSSPAPTPPAPGPKAPAPMQQALVQAQDRLMHQLLIDSGIALAVMAVISAVLGWIIAGRVLGRLRTITTAARDISAKDLHRRLSLAGPKDELKELGDTFDELLGRLEAAFQAQRQFVANASHELRTPLARQRTLGQVALSDPEPTVESLRAAHERILAAGAQQERVIEALLTLARGSTGIDVRRPFDLARLAGEVVEARRPEAAISTSLEPAVTAGHRPLAERLVANLVDNAVRYNIPGGWVDVATRLHNGHAVLTVANSGPVVPPDAVDRLFQPFQRLDPTRGSARTAGGLGLGLSIVAAIASAHDATLAVQPRVEGGLVISVAFPVVDQQPPSRQRSFDQVR